MEDNNNQEQLNENMAAGETAATETETETSQESAAAEAFTPDDTLTERAIRAGMSLADLRECPSKAFAEKIIGVYESKGAAKGGNGGKGADDGEEIPAIDFTDFGEEHGYDPNLSKAMNSLKATIEAQGAVIKRLMAGQKVSPEQIKKAVEVRKNLTLARPGGESDVKTRTPKDPNAAVVAELRRKFKLN